MENPLEIDPCSPIQLAPFGQRKMTPSKQYLGNCL
jgi:hypothetical protein